MICYLFFFFSCKKPRAVTRNSNVEAEPGISGNATTTNALRALGFDVRNIGNLGYVQAVQLSYIGDGAELCGAADITRFDVASAEGF